MPNEIYTYLKENQLTDLDENQFLDKYSKEENANEVYSYLKDQDMTDLEFGDFYSKYLKKKEDVKIGAPMYETGAVEELETSEISVPESELETPSTTEIDSKDSTGKDEAEAPETYESKLKTQIEKSYTDRGGLSPESKISQYMNKADEIGNTTKDRDEYISQLKDIGSELGMHVSDEGIPSLTDNDKDEYKRVFSEQFSKIDKERKEAEKDPWLKDMYQRMSLATDKMVNRYADTMGWLLGLDAIPGYADMVNENRIQNEYSDVALENNRTDQTVESAIDEGNYKEAVGNAVLQMGESLPDLVLLGTTAQAGLAKEGLTAMGLTVGTDKYRELEKTDMPKAAKLYNAAITGFSEVIFERITTLPLLKGFSKSIKKFGKDKVVSATKESLEGGFTKMLANAGAGTKDMIGEAASEMATQFTENLVDNTTVDSNIKLNRGLIDAGAVGLVTAGALKSPQIVNQTKETIQELAQEAFNSTPSDLNVDTRIEAATKIVEKELIEEKKEGIDKAFHEKLDENKKKIDEEIKDISSKDKKNIEKKLEGLKEEPKIEEKKKENKPKATEVPIQESSTEKIDIPKQTEKVEKAVKKDLQEEITKGSKGEIIEPKKKLRTTAERGIKEGAAKETVDIILEKGTKNEYDKDQLKSKSIDAVIEATDDSGDVDMDKLILSKEKGNLSDKEFSYATAAVFDMYKTKAKDLKLSEEERLKFATKAAEVLDVRSLRTEALGQEIELEKDVIRDFPAFSAKVKQINKLGREKTKALKTKTTESGKTADKYTKEVHAELQAEITKAVEEAVGQQKNVIEGLEKDLKAATKSKQVVFGKEQSKKIADKIRKAKIPKNLMFSSALPFQPVWDGLVETVAKTLELTGNVSESVQKGIQQVKESDWYKNLGKNEQSKVEKGFTKEMISLASDKMAKKALKEAKRKEKQAGELDVNKEAEKMMDESESIWTKEKDLAAKSIAAKVKSKKGTKRQKAAIEVFANNVKQVIVDNIPEGDKKTAKTEKAKPSDLIKDVLNNPEKNIEVINQAAQNVLESDLSDTAKEDIGKMFDEILEDPISSKTLQKVISGEIGISPMKAIKEFYSNPEKLGSNLKEYLIDEVGLTEKQADKLAKPIEASIESHLTKGKEQRLKQMLKVGEEITEKEYKSLENKIKEAVRYGAITSEEFQGVFAEKFGFQNINPMEALELEMMVDEIDRLMDEGKLAQATALNKQFNTKLKKLKPKTIINTMEAVNDIHYAGMLSGYNTSFNAGVGGFSSMNFNTFLYGLRYGLGGLTFGAKTAIKNTPDAIREVAAIIRTNTSVYDDLGVLDERKLANSAEGLVEGALSLPFMAHSKDFLKKYLKGEDITLTDKALTEFISSTASRMLIVNSIIKAEDAMMRRNAADVMYAAKEFNEAAKSMGFTGMKVPLRMFNWGKIWKEANKRTGQTAKDRAEINEQVDAEYKEFQESNKKLKKQGKKPLSISNFKGRRRTELWIQRGNEETYNETLKYTSEWLMMSNPDGITGLAYDTLKKGLRYDPNAANYVNGVKFVASIMLPFARMTAQESNVLMRSVPIIGAIPSVVGIRREADGSLNFGWKGNNKELMYQRLLTNALLTASTATLMVDMFEYDDDDELVLDPDRLIDFTAGGSGTSSKQRESGMPSGIGIRWRNPDSPRFDDIQNEARWHSLKIVPHLRPVAAYLGRRADKMKGLLEGDIKGSEWTDFTSAAVLSLTESKYNQVSRAIKKMEMARQDKTKDVGVAMASGLADVVWSQAKGVLTPRILDDVISDVARKEEKGETNFVSFPENSLNGFYGLDHWLSDEMTDFYGKPKPIKNKLGEWFGEYNEPYKELREYKIIDKYPLLKRPLMEKLDKQYQSKRGSILANKEEGRYGEKKAKESYHNNVVNKIDALEKLNKQDLELALDILSKEARKAGAYAIAFKRSNPKTTEKDVDNALKSYLEVDSPTKTVFEFILDVEEGIKKEIEGDEEAIRKEIVRAKITEL